MALTDLTIVRRSMTTRMFSTVTTIVTVAIAVALMLVLLGMRHSGERAFTRGTGDMHLLISRDASPMVSVLNSIFYVNAPQNFIDWPTYESVASSYPWEYAVPTQVGDTFRSLPVVGATPEFFAKFRPAAGEQWALAGGTYFDEPFEVVLGSEAARQTGVHIGQRLLISHGASERRGVNDIVEEEDHDDHDHDHGHDHDAHEEPQAGPGHLHREYSFLVVGILEPTGSAHDRAIFTHVVGSWILHAHDRREREAGGDEIELTTEADLLDEDRKITGIYARVSTRPGREASASVAPIMTALRREGTLTVADPVTEVRRLFQIVSDVDRILLAMAAVVILSSGIGIMLALYNSMEQRRRQIAVLRVLGASRARIFGLVLTESALIGLIGTAAGVVLAFLAGLAVAAIMRARLGLVIEVSVPARELLIVAASGAVLAALAGLVPAAMAYRTSVARNLRPIG